MRNRRESRVARVQVTCRQRTRKQLQPYTGSSSQDSWNKTTARQLANNEVTWVEVTQDFCKLCVSVYGEGPPKQVAEDYTI